MNFSMKLSRIDDLDQKVGEIVADLEQELEKMNRS